MKHVFFRSMVVASLLAASPAHAGWLEDLLNALGGDDSGEAASPAGALGAEEIARGLREALAKGVGASVRDLGRSDGFWQQDRYRVPLPKTLRKAREALDRVGAGAAVDAFHLQLNRAAEQAVPVAADVLEQTVRQMTIRDAAEILRGGDDAATRHFEFTSRDQLAARFRPLVSKVTAQNGLAAYYKQIVQAAGPFSSMLGRAQDLDGYVTDEALDALFDRIAVEEQKIRDNPAARTSELLERVFGGRG